MCSIGRSARRPDAAARAPQRHAVVAVIALAFSLATLVMPAFAGEQRFRVEDSRKYGGGQTETIAEFSVTSTAKKGGGWKHDFELAGAAVVDSSWGYLANGVDGLAHLDASTDAARRSIKLTNAPQALSYINGAAAVGRSAANGAPSKCGGRHDASFVVGLGRHGLPDRVTLSFVARYDNGVCLTRYEVREFDLVGPSGRKWRLTMDGAAVTTPTYDKLLLGTTRYAGRTQGAAFAGRRVIGQLEMSEHPLWKSLHAEAAWLVPPAGANDDRPFFDLALDSVDAQHAAAASAIVEGIAIAYLEGRSNPAPIAFIAAFYLLDQATTTVANGLGAGLSAYVEFSGDSTLRGAAHGLTKWDGVIGKAVKAAGRYAGGEVGASAAGLAYNIAGIRWGNVLGRWAQPAISTFLKNNPKFNRVVSQLLARKVFELAENARTLVNDVGDVAKASATWLSEHAIESLNFRNFSDMTKYISDRGLPWGGASADLDRQARGVFAKAPMSTDDKGLLLEVVANPNGTASLAFAASGHDQIAAGAKFYQDPTQSPPLFMIWAARDKAGWSFDLIAHADARDLMRDAYREYRMSSVREQVAAYDGYSTYAQDLKERIALRREEMEDAAAERDLEMAIRELDDQAKATDEAHARYYAAVEEYKTLAQKAWATDQLVAVTGLVNDFSDIADGFSSGAGGTANGPGGGSFEGPGGNATGSTGSAKTDGGSIGSRGPRGSATAAAGSGQSGPGPATSTGLRGNASAKVEAMRMKAKLEDDKFMRSVNRIRKATKLDGGVDYIHFLERNKRTSQEYESWLPVEP